MRSGKCDDESLTPTPKKKQATSSLREKDIYPAKEMEKERRHPAQPLLPSLSQLKLSSSSSTLTSTLTATTNKAVVHGGI